MFNPVVEQLGTKSVAAALSRNGPRYFEIFHREVPITHLHYFVQVRARNWQHHIYAISHRVQIKPTGAGDGCGKTAEWQLKVLKGIVTFLQTNRRTILRHHNNATGGLSTCKNMRSTMQSVCAMSLWRVQLCCVTTSASGFSMSLAKGWEAKIKYFFSHWVGCIAKPKTIW